MNNLFRCIIAAVIGGAIGAAAWAGITYLTGFEIGWIAWGVGGCVGIATRIGAGESMEGFVPGSIAVLVAIAALLVGKYVAVHLLVGHEMGDLTEFTVTPEEMTVRLADEVVEEWTDAGKTVNWPAGMTMDDAQSQADYPPDAWAEANKRWNAIPADQQQQQMDEQKQMMQMFSEALGEQFTWEAFKGSFSPMDLVFFGLSVFTAFRLGAGLTND